MYDVFGQYSVYNFASTLCEWKIRMCTKLYVSQNHKIINHIYLHSPDVSEITDNSDLYQFHLLNDNETTEDQKLKLN